MFQISNITPVADRLVVRQDTMDEMTQGGIVIPETVRNTKMTGTVLSAGPLCQAKAGDRVYYLAKDNLVLQTDQGEVILMPEFNVLALI